MNDKELNELLEYNQEYMDAKLSEDVFGGDYTSEIELKYLQKDYDKLQSNWNSLREWLMQLKNSYMETDNIFDDAKFRILLTVLDKMNELEGKDKE